ncbi:MAG: XrtA system polysaccharide chain length determinant, partial [Thermodesulfobacteriota bacterium]|jgi:polysaccharide chain length determinant protein (PEP-CTERM system associated)
MINPEKSFNINDYIEILLRRIWYVIIPSILILGGAVLYAHQSPKLYRASTLILVTPQKVPVDYVRPTVTSRIEDRLQSIGQEIMSRTRLEQVISEFKLYQEEAKSLSPEEVVESMRKDIQVEIRGREGYFTISYIGKNPRVVTLVTNKLASLFIEENLKLREQQAQGTSEFLSIELNATKTKLEEQEKTITYFKRQFMNELPEQREANLKVLEQLQNEYQRVSDNLRGAQDRKLVIQKQLNEIRLQITSTSSPDDPSQPLPRLNVNSPYDQQLGQLRGYLADLQTKYTEKHPDIVMTKKKIKDLEQKIAVSREEAGDAKVEGKTIPSPQMAGTNLDFNPFYKEMESQSAATELEVKRLKDEESRIKAKISDYRTRVENAPVRELAMANLTRDYQNTKESYHSLLNKSQEAQQAENLERRQKGEQFKVIDPARIPEKPFKPDVPKILLFGLLLGMGSGFGMAFFREQMDRSFKDAEDLETTLGFKVLANIPKIEKKAA